MKNKGRYRQYISKILIPVLVVGCIWMIFIVRGITWGLPNPVSFAVDAAAIPRPHYSGLEMMHQVAYKYPPLQYLIYDLISPKYSESVDDLEEKIHIATGRLIRFRFLTALMVLGTSLIILFFSRFWMPVWSGMIAALLYLSHGMSVYYAHTTNLDQPYVFWWMLSFYGLCLYLKEFCKVDRDKPGNLPLVTGSLLFGICMFLSIATKDQAYGLYPLLIGVFFLILKEKKLLFPAGFRVIVNKWLIIGLVSGLGLYVLIYFTAGGRLTFELHRNWISTQGVNRFRQFDANLWSRAVLVGSSLKDLYRALNIPLLILFTLGIFSWGISLKKLKKSVLWGKAGFFLMAAPGFSMVLFFIQVARFCYPRFWLPVLPLVCIVSAYGIYFLADELRKRKILLSFFTLLIIWNMLGGLEVIYILEKDSRVLAKDAVNKILFEKDQELTVGVLGSVFGYRYVIDEWRSVHRPVRTVRNWEDSSFGIVSLQQVSLVLDPFAVFIVQPGILLGGNLSRKNIQEINKMGYCLLVNILPVKPVFNRFGTLPDVVISIFTRVENKIHFPESRLSLEEQLMIIRSLRKELAIEGNETLLKRIGVQAHEFYEPDLADKTINADDVELLAISYQLAGKKKSAVKAFDFVCSKWPSPDHFYNRDICFKRMGIITGL